MRRGGGRGEAWGARRGEAEVRRGEAARRGGEAWRGPKEENCFSPSTEAWRGACRGEAARRGGEARRGDREEAERVATAGGTPEGR